VSTDDSRDRALNSGAMAFITKPVASSEVIENALFSLKNFVAKGRNTVVALMPPGKERDRLVSRLTADDIDVVACADKDGLAAALRSGEADCLVIQTGYADVQPNDLIEMVEERSFTRQLPVVLFGGDTTDALARWKRPDGVFALREARSPERLLDTIYLHLHRNVLALSQEQREAVQELHNSSRVLEKKKVLVVDDDMRNIFALSTVLHDQGMHMVSANNGREAIRLVKEHPDIDIVLMDIMMPEMDGITTMQEIRKLPEKKDLPIIAVTAKAMKGDREKCIRAGAWDYLSKPVDTVHLLAVLRGWLHR
jgi:CheY-like chemotaxis protein